MRVLKHNLKLRVNVEEIPSPDPRVPIADCKYQIWKYEGQEAIPAIAEPGEDIALRIAELAKEPFDDRRNWASASKIAADCGSGKIAEILAVMLYPPLPPPTVTALKWIQRVQLAATQVVAQVDEGWEGSERREALLSILFGPRDWTTNAAIRVLTFIAENEYANSAKISEAFAKLAEHRPRRGYCPWEYTLFSNWMRLPHLLDEERESIENVLFQLER